MQYETLADLLRRLAQERPDGLALVCEDRAQNFEMFDRRASQVANGLISSGVRPEARFGYLCKNNDYVFELLFGAAKSGAVAVGLNWRLAPAELAYILDDAEIEIVFVDAEMAPLLARALAGRPDAKTVINLDGGDGPQLDYRAWRDAASAADPNLASSPGDVVFQLYTSGTTGHPKGVQITHANIAAQRAAEALSGDWARLRDGDVGLVVMPLYHVGGLMMGLVSICAGVLTVVSKNTDAKALVELIDAYQVTTTFLVPVLIQNLLDEAVNAPEKLAQVRALRYGAAAMPPALLLRAQATLRCGLLQVYGMTETTGAIAYLPPEDHCEAEFERRMKSCGKAMPGIDIKIMDANGADAAANCMGEICVRGDVVMKGYWRREAETALANGDGWYKSGDAGRIDDDGYIYLGDRIKDMIISGGENIYPAEVENALLEHPAVHEVAVIGVPDQKWGEAVKAFVVPRAAGDVDEASLIAFAAARIAKYKVPKIVTFVEALPRNPSGKVLKRELRALGI